MTIFKCKMCGGDLEVTDNMTVAECDYCGTKQTVPKAMDENLQNLFNRANTLRIKSEFDKAEKLYEKIIEADAKQSEAYWGLILCKYGIEYVDDPATYKKVPTCHRASYASIIADDDYKSALEHADMSQRAIYEEQAKEIDRIQKDILALAQNEEAYDVFICYKETDADGRRTQDSVIANDIYYQLTNEGYKVFYAAITLEDKLGTAYEPYIFAALNSAKVMVVLGTKPEYFNAVWVKNEWSRYLALIKQDPKKVLIPAYKDMDPYDLPEEFSHLQAQDMSKLGFMQDLIRGVRKIAQTDEPKTTVVKETVVSAPAVNANIASLLRRAFLFLEDEEWQNADEYCEKVLDLEPENAEAYLGKLMAELEVCTREELKDCDEPFDDYSNYGKIMRFGKEDLKAEIKGYINHINERNIAAAYDEAVAALLSATDEKACLKAAEQFADLGDYLDAKQKITECHEKVAELNYHKALYRMQNARSDSDFLAAAQMFEKIVAYRDAKQMAEACHEKISELHYNKAMGFMQTANTEGAFLAAAEMFEKIVTYRDAKQMAEACHAKAEECLDVARKNGVITYAKNIMDQRTVNSYQQAIHELESLNGWGNSEELIEECKNEINVLTMEQKRQEKQQKILGISVISVISLMIVICWLTNYLIIPNMKYNDAIELMDTGKYTEAISAFEALEGYRDSMTKIVECRYNYAIALMDAGKYTEAISAFEALNGHKDSANKITECNTAILDGKYNDAIALMDAGFYSLAIPQFSMIAKYKDSMVRLEECKYNYAIELMNEGDLDKAYGFLIELGDYNDAAKKANDIRLTKSKDQ